MNKQQLENLLILLAHVASFTDSVESLTDTENNDCFAGLIIRNSECILKVYNDYAGYMDGIQEIIINLDRDSVRQFEQQLIRE